jgi:hypothetical protein
MEFGEEQQISARHPCPGVVKPQYLLGRLTLDTIAGTEYSANTLLQFLRRAIGDHQDLVLFPREVSLIDNPAPDALFLADSGIE